LRAHHSLGVSLELDLGAAAAITLASPDHVTGVLVAHLPMELIAPCGLVAQVAALPSCDEKTLTHECEHDRDQRPCEPRRNANGGAGGKKHARNGSYEQTSEYAKIHVAQYGVTYGRHCRYRQRVRNIRRHEAIGR
jgi:hypothetical protein